MRQQMVEIGGIAPSMEDCPPDMDEFPVEVTTAFDIFSLLPDRYLPKMEGKPIYLGKDLSSINMFFELYYITSSEEKLDILKFINILDSSARKELNKK